MTAHLAVSKTAMLGSTPRWPAKERLMSFLSVSLWVDDERPMPEGFGLHAKYAELAIEILKSGLSIHRISLDHDLGSSFGTGYDVAKWIEERAYYGELSRIAWSVHSANPVGRKKIEAALTKADEYWAGHEKEHPLGFV